MVLPAQHLNGSASDQPNIKAGGICILAVDLPAVGRRSLRADDF